MVDHWGLPLLSKSFHLVAASLLALVVSGPAWAQSGDVIIMRKAMVATGQGSPGTVPSTPSVGTPTASPTPAPARGGWVVGEWAFVGTSSCTATATQTRTVSCEVAGIRVDASRCDGAAPETQRTASDYRGCAFSWNEGAWSPYSSTCSARATRTRDVSCLRSDGTTAPESSCDPAARPAVGETSPVYEGCSFSWKTGEFLDPGPSCTTAETQTRTVTCQRDLDGSVTPDASCAPQPRPESTTIVEDLSSCGYEATDWSPYVASSTCSATATKTRTAQCRRSDGTKVADTECTGRGIALSETVTEENYSSCTYDWNAQPWSEPSTTCGQAQFSRAVTCRSLPDGRFVADAQCDISRKPSASKTEEVVSGCSFSWKPGAWGAVTPACGSSVQTREVVCERSDGTRAADGQCSSAGVRPVDQQPATDYSTCTYGWSADAWSAWSTSCGTGTRTRGVSCRSSDGRTVADAQCTTARPETSQEAYQISGCGYNWTTEAWRAPAAACGATTQDRPVYCLRTDGALVGDEMCAAGSRPPATQATTDYQACSYAWTAGAWSAPSTTCGEAVQTRAVSCTRSDGAAADDSRCRPEDRPAASQTGYRIDGCGYNWTTEAWRTPAPACGATTQDRPVYCLRSDGAWVGDEMCAAGSRPAASQPTTDYSTCSYQYTTSEWTPWSSTCSSDAIRRRTVYCERSDGAKTNTDYTNCVAAGRTYPGYEEHSAIYSSCTYTPAYGAWEPCEFMGTRRRPVTCTRSDGTKVDATYCGAQTADFEYGSCEVAGEARGTKNFAGPGEEILRSPNGQFRLVMQVDGDLAILNAAGAITWHVNTHVSGTTFYFQGDGNMVLYRPCPTGCGAVDAVWSSDTWANTRAYYVLDDVGQLTIYNQDRSPNIIFRSQGGTSSYFSPTRR
jgi:hypothetical protein